MFSLLRNGAYFRLWSAQIISQLGDGVTEILILYLIAVKTNNPLMISFAIFAQLLPSAVFGVFMGPISDRFPKRWVMVVSDVYCCLIIVTMIFVQNSPWALLGLIFLQGFGTALFTPARSASIPLLVGRERITEAVALSQASASAMRVIGPSLGGIFLLLNHTNTMFLIDSLTFLVSAILLSTLTQLSSKSLSTHSSETYLASLKSGVSTVIGMPALRFLLILLIPVTLAGGILSANLPAVLLNTFEVPSPHFGFLEGIMGVGSILGAFLGPLLLKRVRPGLLLLTATALFGSWMIFVYPLDTLRVEKGLATIYTWCCVAGIFNALINVPLGSLFSIITPTDFRGRASALLQATINLSVLSGILLGGWLGGICGVLFSTVIGGILLVAVVFFIPLFKGYRALHIVGGKSSSTASANDTLNT